MADVNPVPQVFFRAGWIYTLKDPTQFDDDAGTGYDHAMIDAKADPGVCWVHDAWIVNAAGDTVHPGYASAGVPVRLTDVDLEKGRKA